MKKFFPTKEVMDKDEELDYGILGELYAHHSFKLQVHYLYSASSGTLITCVPA